jgi:hypothetical protein
MATKREPTLADRLIASRRTWNKKADEAARNRLLLAKRFVLDEDAARYVGQMIRRVPRIIADAQDFAIPPFENMWVEIPFDAWFEAINEVDPTTHWSVTGHGGEFRDTNVGFLISGGHHVRVGTWGPGDGIQDAIWTGVEFFLHRPWTREEEMEFRQKYFFSGLTLDDFFWGTSSRDVLSGDPGAHEAIRALRAEHSVRVLEPTGLEGYDPHRFKTDEGRMALHKSIIEGSGDLRNVIALLLFLNRTSDIQLQREVGVAQGFIGNKVKPYLSHRVITLKVDRDDLDKRLKKLVAGHGSTKRLHDVRGHFCHNERAKTSGCMHPEWEETDWETPVPGSTMIPRRWKCLQCNGLRWWRKEHERGHEEKGLITSEYKVTTG